VAGPTCHPPSRGSRGDSLCPYGHERYEEYEISLWEAARPMLPGALPQGRDCGNGPVGRFDLDRAEDGQPPGIRRSRILLLALNLTCS
jgi:hypothetical protein